MGLALESPNIEQEMEQRDKKSLLLNNSQTH